MAMRRTTILVEVDDNVYTELVEPMKKAKTFSRLVATLLTGYLSDGYIQAYADNTLEDFHKASIGALNDVVESMKAGLSDLGLFTEEIEASAQSGYSKFKKKAEEQAKEVENGPPLGSTNTKQNNNGVDERLERLEKIVEESTKTQSEQFASLMNMMTAFFSGASIASGGVSLVSKPADLKEEAKSVEIRKPVETPVQIVENNEDSLFGSLFEEGEADTSGNEDVNNSEVDGDAFLANMLSGNAYSF